MLGGEFCGNATRSALWLLSGGQRRTGFVEVSGVDCPLIFSVRDKEVMLEMPLPRDGELVRRVDEGLIVQLDGIAQLVMSPRSNQLPRQLLGTLLKDNKYRLAKQPAVGISAYDEETKQATFCVWVRDIDTMFDETACGSGTSAIGVAQAWETGRSVVLDIIQPSGETIRAETTVKPGTVDASFITGSVSILYDGPMELA
jgi:diaminopimelate epimerase